MDGPPSVAEDDDDDDDDAAAAFFISEQEHERSVKCTNSNSKSQQFFLFQIPNRKFLPSIVVSVEALLVLARVFLRWLLGCWVGVAVCLRSACFNMYGQ